MFLDNALGGGDGDADNFMSSICFACGLGVGRLERVCLCACVRGILGPGRERSGVASRRKLAQRRTRAECCLELTRGLKRETYINNEGGDCDRRLSR